MRKNTAILGRAAENVSDLAQLTGVSKHLLDGNYDPKNLTGKERRQLKRISNLENLSSARRGSLILLSVFYFYARREMVSYFSDQGKKFMTQKKFQRDSKIIAESRGRKRHDISMVYESTTVLPLNYFPIEWRYRDPTRATRYNFHWGAPSKWRAYGMRFIRVFGNREKGGRRGTTYQGIGFHPRKKKARASAKFPDDYFLFRRVGYPGGVGEGSKITGKEGIVYPLYNWFLNEKRLYRPIGEEMAKAGAVYGSEITQTVIRSVRDSAKSEGLT